MKFIIFTLAFSLKLADMDCIKSVTGQKIHLFCAQLANYSLFVKRIFLLPQFFSISIESFLLTFILVSKFTYKMFTFAIKRKLKLFYVQTMFYVCFVLV